MNKLNFAKRACAVLALCAATAITLQAQTYGVLYSFDVTDGYPPEAALIQATDGNFYGTTTYGGAYGNGTVFKITPSGTFTTLYSFCAQSNCTDGSWPSGVIQATDGNFYGTTAWGGAYDRGTIFQITPGGTLSTLYTFCSQGGCTDGAWPYAGVIQATDGNFYGTTWEGGSGRVGNVSGGGTVFRFTTTGRLTTLYSFCALVV